MTTATIYRIYQVTLPDSDDPHATLRAFLEQARQDDSAFDCLKQDDVDGELNYKLTCGNNTYIVHQDEDIKMPTALSTFEQELMTQAADRIEELRKQVAERDALLAEKDATLDIMDAFMSAGELLTLRDETLAKKLPSEAMERALAAEREKCAVVCESLKVSKGNNQIVVATHMAYDDCAEIVRSMK